MLVTDLAQGVRRGFDHWWNGRAAFDGRPLADVLGVVPDVMDMLPPDSWSALSGCNKALRQLVHSRTSTFFVERPSDVESLIMGEWPELSLIIICTGYVDAVPFWPPEASMQLLLAVQLSADTLSTSRRYTLDATALVVSSKLQRIPCQLDGVVVNDVPLARYLQNPQWHVLRRVRLLSNHFGATGIAQLTAIQQQPNYRSLHGTSAHMQHYVQSSWSALMNLSLNGCLLSCSAVAAFAGSNWPALQMFDLSTNRLAASAMASLASAQLPNLRELKLNKNQLDLAAMEQLVKARWPKLYLLDLRSNLLDDGSMLHLAKTNWPRLAYLGLYGNLITLVGVTYLTTGKMLNREQLEESIMSDKF